MRQAENQREGERKEEGRAPLKGKLMNAHSTCLVVTVEDTTCQNPKVTLATVEN